MNPIEQPTGKGVLPGSEGVILQRGGEELRLHKVDSRLSLCLSDASALPALIEQWQPQTSRNISPQAVATSPVIIEWQMSSEQIETTLEQLRPLPAVLYASHVYELAVSPGTYVYLGNQLTVQFVDSLRITEIEAIARTFASQGASSRHSG